MRREIRCFFGSNVQEKVERDNQTIFDVSLDKEFSFILHHMVNHYPDEELTEDHLIVDIGAYDGMIQSNSYNFIQLGWSALLVEPSKRNFESLKRNMKNLMELKKKYYFGTSSDWR